MTKKPSKDPTGESTPSTRPTPSPAAGLIVSPQEGEGAEKDKFGRELERTLKETQDAVLELESASLSPEDSKSWQTAREIVERFRPVPWFIWRISNFVLGSSGQVNTLSEGMVFGLRRLLFACASDPVLGTGTKVNSMRAALDVLSSDIVAAVSVIHAICRRLASFEHERIWRPILEDALLRARIGLIIGRGSPEFGGGRGMLAGFAGRCGLAILIAQGELEQARRALEMLATGSEIKSVGLAVYRCDPLQFSAMVLSATGCGRDASFGTVAYASKDPSKVVVNLEQRRWLGAFTVSECVRTGRLDEVSPDLWEALSIDPANGPIALSNEFRTISRRGHGWGWMV